MLGTREQLFRLQVPLPQPLSRHLHLNRGRLQDRGSCEHRVSRFEAMTRLELDRPVSRVTSTGAMSYGGAQAACPLGQRNKIQYSTVRALNIPIWLVRISNTTRNTIKNDN